MPMIRWNMNLLIGIREIDENHRQLVHLLNEAYDEFVMGIKIGEPFIEELFGCMAHCFDCEESWMIKHSYPHLPEHQAEHELFTIRFLEINKNYKGDANTSAEILVFLNNWIKHHICETDSKLGDFVNVRNLGNRRHRLHMSKNISQTQ